MGGAASPRRVRHGRFGSVGADAERRARRRPAGFRPPFPAPVDGHKPEDVRQRVRSAEEVRSGSDGASSRSSFILCSQGYGLDLCRDYPNKCLT